MSWTPEKRPSFLFPLSQKRCHSFDRIRKSDTKCSLLSSFEIQLRIPILDPFEFDEEFRHTLIFRKPLIDSYGPSCTLTKYTHEMTQNDVAQRSDPALKSAPIEAAWTSKTNIRPHSGHPMNSNRYSSRRRLYQNFSSQDWQKNDWLVPPNLGDIAN